MKKFLFVIIIGLFSISSRAQGIQSEFRMGYDAGVDQDKNLSLGIDYILGYRLTPKFRLGAGVGIDYVKLLFEEAHVTKIGKNLFYDDEYRESAVSIPIFANAKVNFTETKVSPFFELNAGYNKYIACSSYAEDNKLGFFAYPAFGIDINVGTGAIVIQTGYKYQVRRCDKWTNPDGDYSQVAIKVGYQF